jgi:hypothetical protein
MRTLLKVAFILVLVAMTWVTWTASLDRDVLTAGREIWADPWGRATLFDAYFAFLTVWLLIAWRERGWLARILWLVAILILGNFAIAAYFLIALWRLPKGADWGAIFARKPRAGNRPAA